ncbi:response regulator transcription factor [Deinococcus yavapaiensis]|uniref:response regulator transcription factor n=1 Tax=Deinococcus yavapaiensis TaxID=309889 RepID=UPI001473003A|nr:response regulator transcription factor [Deinococcus yavapaiensis]
MPSVAIVEDEALFRALLRGALTATGGVSVLAEYGDAPSALGDAMIREADVVLLDIDLGSSEVDGIGLGMQLREHAPRLGVVLLSNHAHLAFAHALIASEMVGWAYLLKKSVRDLDTLLRAISAVRVGEIVLDPALVGGRKHPHSARFSHLTWRQIELWELITQGFSNAAIAQRLGRSQKWIDNAVGGLYAALGVDTHDPTINARVAAALLYAREAQNAHLTSP